MKTKKETKQERLIRDLKNRIKRLQSDIDDVKRQTRIPSDYEGTDVM